MYNSLVAGLSVVAANLLVASTAVAQVATVTGIQPPQLQINADNTTFDTVQPAIVTLTINAPVSITVSSPQPQGFVEPADTTLTSVIRYGGTAAQNGQPLTIDTVPAAGVGEVEVSMQAIRSNPYPAGDYTYNVTLTIAPQ